MDYTFISDGKLRFFGCPVINVEKLYPSKFSIGEILYPIRKARLGILEKIAIKKVILNFKDSQPIFIYKDTFNSLHDEEELCRYLEAQQEVESFNSYIETLIMNTGGCGVTEYFTNVAASSRTTAGITRTLRKLKSLINNLRSDNFKTGYIDNDVKASEIIKEIDSLLLDGGSP
jgi:hypothetical protein